MALDRRGANRDGGGRIEAGRWKIKPAGKGSGPQRTPIAQLTELAIAEAILQRFLARLSLDTAPE